MFLGLLLASCASKPSTGSSGSTSQGFLAPVSASASGSEQAAATASAVAAVPHVTYRRKWTVQGTAPDKSTWTTTLEVGNVMTTPQAFGKVPVQLATACSLDQQRDAVIPYRIANTSTTTGFSIAAESAFEFTTSNLYGTPEGWNLTAGEHVDQATSFNECNDVSDDDGTSPPAIILNTTNLAPGASSQATGLIVLRNYYSPAQPQGDSTFEPQIWLSPTSILSSTTWTASNLTGPGVINKESFPIDGKELPSCAAIQRLAADSSSGVSTTTPCTN